MIKLAIASFFCAGMALGLALGNYHGRMVQPRSGFSEMDVALAYSCGGITGFWEAANEARPQLVPELPESCARMRMISMMHGFTAQEVLEHEKRP